MRKVLVILIALLLALGAWLLTSQEDKKMPITITFDLDHNIHETAKNSGIPVKAFGTRRVNNTFSYHLVNLNRAVKLTYNRPGYEITWDGVFAFTMYANQKRSDNLNVDSITLQQHGDFPSHEAARAFIEQTIEQFQNGNWERYFRDHDTRVTGRSSLLDGEGNILRVIKNVDPAYKIPDEDWIPLLRKTLFWRWIGDGIVAELSAKFSPIGPDSTSYTIFLKFDNEAIKNQIYAENLENELKAGDAKGRNATVEYEQGLLDLQRKNAQLEAAAIARGDSVVPR